MQTSSVLSMTGLILDMAGVLLMFIFGISPMIDTNGHQFITTVRVEENIKKKARKYKKCSRIGLVLVFLGFSFQLWGYLIKL